MSEAPKPRTSIRGTIAAPAAERKVYLATPAYGATFCGEYVRSLFMLMRSRPKVSTEFLFYYFDYADVVTARNYLISDFFFNNPQCTHILFVDDDMGFDASLIFEMLDLSEPVVGTIYTKRRVDLKKLHASGELPFETALARASDFIGEERKPFERKRGFMSVNYCGTGIMLISRPCIEEMIRKFPDLVDTRRFKLMPYAERFTRFLTPFDKIRTDDFELSEDFSFCRRWVVDCHGKIWAHPGSNIRHVGAMTYGAKFTER